MSTKNERAGLLVATILFALMAAGQLWRFFSHTPVMFGGTLVPVWPSLLTGLVALAMAIWMGALFRNRKSVM